MAQRLTEDSARRMVNPPSGQTFLWDDLVRGFGLRATPTGKAYVIQWRAGDGRKIRKTIGHWPARTVADARDAARSQLADSIQQTATGGDAKLATAMREWYRINTGRRAWSPRYTDKVDGIIRLYIEGLGSERVTLKPALQTAVERLGAKAVADVRAPDVLTVADKLPQGRSQDVMAIVSSFYGYAMEREWAVGNPARNRLRKTGGRMIRRRLLSEGEFRALWKAFDEEGGPTAAAFKVLAYTGARREMVTQMRWAELNLEAALWTLPPERRKYGNRDPNPYFRVTLAPRAVEIIRSQPALEGSPYVFWGRRDRRAFDFQESVLRRVRAAAAVEDWRLHDLRRVVRSGMAGLGIREVVAERCLGHIVQTGLVKVYDVHDYGPEMAEAWLRWARRLEELVA